MNAKGTPWNKNLETTAFVLAQEGLEPVTVKILNAPGTAWTCNGSTADSCGERRFGGGDLGEESFLTMGGDDLPRGDDGGQSFVPYHGAPITDYSLTWGLAATEVPGLVYMHAASALWVSENDGCTWTQFGSTAFNLFRIATGSGGVAYLAVLLRSLRDSGEGNELDPNSLSSPDPLNIDHPPRRDFDGRASSRTLGFSYTAADHGRCWSMDT